MWNADAHSYPGRYSLGLAKEADHPEILNGTERDPVDSYPQEISFLITRGVTFPSGPGEGAGPPWDRPLVGTVLSSSSKHQGQL